MSQNVTLHTMISPAQSVAVAALVNGSTVTQAAEKAGVTRETVSRWVHRDPVFIAEFQNARAEVAARSRCALEALGEQAIATLADAIRNKFMLPTRLRAACAVLKMLGADRAETIAPTTAEEVDLRLRQRAEELRKCESALDASEAIGSQSIDVTNDPEGALDVKSSSETRRDEDELDDSGCQARQVARVQLTRDGESKPGGIAEPGRVAGAETLVDQWTSCLKDVVNHLDEPGRVADQATAAAASQDDQGAVDGASLTELLHHALSRSERPAPPLPPEPRPRRVRALR